MTDRSGTLERVGPPVAQPQPLGPAATWEIGVLKAFIPWGVFIAIWEIAAANGWAGKITQVHLSKPSEPMVRARRT